jgi:phosphoserine phosphatase RsbU/P
MTRSPRSMSDSPEPPSRAAACLVNRGAMERLFFRQLIDRLPDYVYFKDKEGRFLCVNRAWADLHKVANPEDAVGLSDYDFFTAEFAREKDADEREIIRSGRGFVGKEERDDQVAGDVRWASSTKLPLYDENGQIIGTWGVSRDITDAKRAREALDAHHRLLETLIEILPCRIFVKDAEGRLRITNAGYRAAIGVPDAEAVRGRRLSELVQDDRTAHSAADDSRVLGGESILNREEYDASPIGDKMWSLLSKVPLRDGDGRVTGLVGMSADITAQKVAEDNAVRAQLELAAKNRQIEAELLLARDLLTELMYSSVQAVAEVFDGHALFSPEIAYHYEPCEHLAGDFFQAIPLGSQRFGLLVCDVMGHGVKAALVTTLIRGLIADIQARDVDPGEVLRILNERLCVLLDRPPLPRFVTALYAVFDLGLGRVRLASAGHPWPLRTRAAGQPGPVTQAPCGPALGLIPDAAFPSVENSLTQGDRWMLFTDGWTEESDPSGEEFGTARLATSLQELSGLAPADALTRLAERVRSFSGAQVRRDDLCALLVGF